MRVPQSGKQKRPHKPKPLDNGKFIDHNKKYQSASNEKSHDYINMKTGLKTYAPTSYLLRLADEFIDYIRNQDTAVCFEDFWEEKGILYRDVWDFCQSEPMFARKIEYARMALGRSWSDPLLGKKELLGDRETLRKRASIYKKEWGDYDKSMIEFTERVKHAIEEDDKLKQMKDAKDIAEWFHVIGEKEKEYARVEAEAKIRSGQSDSQPNEPSTGQPRLLEGDKQGPEDIKP